MAKANLDKELNTIYKLLFPPAEVDPKTGKKKKKGGADGPLRELLNKEVHIFSMNVTQLTNQIMVQGMRDSANKKRDPHLKDKDRQLVVAFAKDLINAMIKLAESKAKKAPSDFRINHSKKDTSLKITVSGVANPYNTLSLMRTEAGETIEGKHTELFKKTKAKTTGSLVQIGHEVSVAAAKGAALLNSLEDQREQQGEVTPFMVGGIDVTRDAIDQVKTFMAKHKINIEHYRDVRVVNGELKDRIHVTSSAEGGDYNQILKANRDTGGGIPEREIGAAIKDLIENIQKTVNEYYSKMGAKERAKAKTSRSMMDDMTNVILSTTKMKKATKNKKLTKRTPKVQKPNSFKDKAKGRERKYKTKVNKDNNYIPLAAKKPTRTGTAAASQKANGMNSGQLLALLNAKLPQTVAKNMGPPGLENQTGRFASSVKVTDVNQTAQGHPSIGYTYQKNPYQVFEMTHGDPRWATPDRDPRKVIDASVREIAAQFAIGRFYTRRI